MFCIMFAAGLTGGYWFSPFIPEAIFCIYHIIQRGLNLFIPTLFSV